MPRKSAEILAKLTDYERQIMDEAQLKIAEKRAAVAKTLDAHLESETKRGNLSGAVAIRDAIAMLQPTHKVSEPSSSQPKPINEWIVGTKWTWYDGIGTAEFFENGRVQYSERRVTYKWEIKDESTIRVLAFNGEVFDFEFSKDRAKYETKKGKGKILE